MGQVTAIRLELCAVRARRGELAEEELLREDDAPRCRLLFDLVEPRAQRSAARDRDLVQRLVRPVALFDAARANQPSADEAGQRLVDLALGRCPEMLHGLGRQSRELVAGALAEGHQTKDGALGG